MIKTRRKAMLYFIGALILSIAAVIGIKISPPGFGTYVSSIFSMLPHIVYIGLLCGWVISVRKRILNNRIRRYLIAVGLLMIFWITVRTVKWRFVSEFEPLGRYLWYSYYIPMIFIPLLGVGITDCIGKGTDYKAPLWLMLLFVPASLLVLLVFTNDFHNFVFTFPSGNKFFDSAYSYAGGFYVVCAWFVILGFYFVISLIIKSRVPGSKTFQIMPLVIMGCSVVFWIVYATGIFRTDLTAIDCLMITLLLESAIESGLIRSNAGYTELFEISTVRVQVVDKDFQTRYISSCADDLPEYVMRNAVSKPFRFGKTVIHGKPVSGGYAIWHDDIRQIKELTNHLKETRERLSESNILLKAEIDMREQKLRLDEKNRLYDRIAADVSSQLLKAEELLAQAEKNPQEAGDILAQICVISAYIKRRSNLLLLGEECRVISSAELDFCLRESLDNLRLMDIAVSFNSNCRGTVDIEAAVAAYDLFQNTIEAFLNHMNAALISLMCENSVIKLVVQLGCEEGTAASVADNLNIEGKNISLDIDENDVTLCMLLGEGGGSI